VEASPALLVERAGGDHVRVQRQDPAGEEAEQRGVRVGREDDRGGAHEALGGDEREGLSGADAQDRGVLVDSHAHGLQRGAQAAEEGGAVDPAGGGVEDGPVRAGHADRVGGQPAQVEAPRAVGLGPRLGGLGGARGGVDLEAAAAREAAVDRRARGEVGHDVDARAGRGVHALAEVLVVRGHAVDPAEDLAAVAAAGAVGEAAGLEQDDAAIGVAPREVPRGGHAGDAAADDGDIGRGGPAERG
jgi:hypothetical protein